MTEQVENQNLENNVAEVEPSEYSEVEQLAMENGWKPKEQYSGDPAKWRSAELFMELKPFYERIESQSKLIKQNQKQFQDIAKDMATVRQQAYDKAINDLKSAKRNAMRDGDLERVSNIDDQLDNVREQKQKQLQIDAQKIQEATQPEQTGVLHPSFVDWQNRNTWYTRDEDLKDWADARGQRLAAQGTNPDAVLAQLEREVKQKFPEKFTNPNAAKPSAVAAGGSKPSAKAAKLNMSDEERRIMNTIIRSGALTEDEYVKQYLAQQ